MFFKMQATNQETPSPKTQIIILVRIIRDLEELSKCFHLHTGFQSDPSVRRSDLLRVLVLPVERG